MNAGNRAVKRTTTLKFFGSTATLGAITDVTANQTKPSTTVPTGTVAISGFRTAGIRLYFTSGGTTDEAVPNATSMRYQLFAVHRVASGELNTPDPVYITTQLNTCGDFWLSTSYNGTSLSSDFFTSTARFCRTPTFTKNTANGYATALETAFGFTVKGTTGIAEAPGELFITDVGDIWGLQLHMYPGSTKAVGAGANALITLSV